MTATAGFKDLFVEVPGARLAVRDHPGGPGAPIVLVHGGARTLADWDAVVPDLLPHHRVVTYDVRGHGQSSPVETWTLAEALKDLEAVIGELDLDDPIVAGHSMGGMIATMYGDAHPECRGIVNVDGSGVAIPSSMPGVEDGPARLLAAIDEAARKEREAVVETPGGDAAWVEAQVEQLRVAVEGSGMDWSVLEAGARRTYFRVSEDRFEPNPSPRMWAVAYDDIRQLETFAILRRLKCPVLYIRASQEDPGEPSPGEPDPELLRAHARGSAIEIDDIAAGNPRFQVRVAASGHMVNLELPHEVAAWLLEFAAGLTQR
jgi:pimeloyl-ACP methyl ester carboxylesterase